MPFNFPDYKKGIEMQFALSSLTLPSTSTRSTLRRTIIKRLKKSLSFDTDAVVLLPLFMKCLFCFFNEIFNVKLQRRVFSARPRSEFPGETKRERKRHGRSNSGKNYSRFLLCYDSAGDVGWGEGRKGITSEVFPHTQRQWHAKSFLRSLFTRKQFSK